MAIGILSGCSSNIDYYKDSSPKLDLQTFLQGKIHGTGLIQDWRHRVTKKFEFDADASWKGDVGTLDEHMIYENGEKDHRIWTLKKISANHYQGTSKDVIGIADINIEGNAVNWRYQMDIKVDNSTYRIHLDDWMFLMKNGTLINKNYFKKFGLTVGSLTLFMEKKPAKASPST